MRVTCLNQLYLRELPEPLFRLPLADRLQHTEHRGLYPPSTHSWMNSRTNLGGDFHVEEHLKNRFPLLKSKIRRLPPVHQATLKAVLEHLARVASRCAINKMDVRNLAIVFGTVIFGEDELPKNNDVLSVAAFKVRLCHIYTINICEIFIHEQDTVMEDLISNATIIFEDLASKRPPPISLKSVTPPSIHQSLSEPPLPIPPPEESPSGVDYGSSFTKVITLPPRTSTSKEQDFTPTLPSRPTPSIHPSRRTGTNASIRSDTSASASMPLPSPAATSFREKEREESEELMSISTHGEHIDSPMSSEYASAYASLQSTSGTPASETTGNIASNASATQTSLDSSQTTTMTAASSKDDA